MTRKVESDRWGGTAKAPKPRRVFDRILAVPTRLPAILVTRYRGPVESLEWKVEC